MQELTNCQLCPRLCGADRTKHPGYCGAGSNIKAARAALHLWEEPCISGEEGSGTVFFSGCPLGCCFCQNHEISSGNIGAEITVERLGEIFLELQNQGANNINLVTATPYVPHIIGALNFVKDRLTLPIVYNSSGYENLSTLQLLCGYVDVYLPDLKYMSPERGEKYSAARDYFEVASKAILEMYRQVGAAQFDRRGLMTRGLIVRHLVLPEGEEDTAQILHWLRDNLPLEDVMVSLMSQYTPFYHSGLYPELGRRLTKKEYRRALSALDELGIENGFVQELSSAKEEYTPRFDMEGIL